MPFKPVKNHGRMGYSGVKVPCQSRNLETEAGGTLSCLAIPRLVLPTCIQAADATWDALKIISKDLVEACNDINAWLDKEVHMLQGSLCREEILEDLSSHLDYIAVSLPSLKV